MVNMETIVTKHLFLYSYIHNDKRAKQLIYFDKNLNQSLPKILTFNQR